MKNSAAGAITALFLLTVASFYSQMPLQRLSAFGQIANAGVPPITAPPRDYPITAIYANF